MHRRRQRQAGLNHRIRRRPADGQPGGDARGRRSASATASGSLRRTEIGQVPSLPPAAGVAEGHGRVAKGAECGVEMLIRRRHVRAGVRRPSARGSRATPTAPAGNQSNPAIPSSRARIRGPSRRLCREAAGRFRRRDSRGTGPTPGWIDRPSAGPCCRAPPASPTPRAPRGSHGGAETGVQDLGRFALIPATPHCSSFLRPPTVQEKKGDTAMPIRLFSDKNRPVHLGPYP